MSTEEHINELYSMVEIHANFSKELTQLVYKLLDRVTELEGKVK
jgi:hypothetical protein